MALIKTYVHPTIGCTISVYDDDCRCPAAEMEQRRKALDRTIAQLLRDPATRERLRQYNLEHYGHE